MHSGSRSTRKPPHMKTIRLLPSAFLLATGLGLAGTPAAPAPDKSAHNLFNPVPDNLLRDLDTDRPDKTNSPHTLDAGHFQIESGLFAYTRTTASGVRSENFSWADTVLRVGLLPWAELQVEVPVYQTNRDTLLATHDTQHTRGSGDLAVFLKANLWGNEAGDTAGGLEFWVKTPTASQEVGNRKVEGGALFLWDFKLPGDFDLGVNNGVGISANDSDNGYHADIINSVSVSHTITGPLTGYLEFYSLVPTRGNGDWVGSLDVGLLLTIGKNVQVDAGINMGVTNGADDWQPFVGLSCRF